MLIYHRISAFKMNSRYSLRKWNPPGNFYIPTSRSMPCSARTTRSTRPSIPLVSSGLRISRLSRRRHSSQSEESSINRPPTMWTVCSESPRTTLAYLAKRNLRSANKDQARPRLPGSPIPAPGLCSHGRRLQGLALASGSASKNIRGEVPRSSPPHFCPQGSCRSHPRVRALREDKCAGARASDRLVAGCP
jgi:hypothetical protein